MTIIGKIITFLFTVLSLGTYNPSTPADVPGPTPVVQVVQSTEPVSMTTLPSTAPTSVVTDKNHIIENLKQPQTSVVLNPKIKESLLFAPNTSPAVLPKYVTPQNTSNLIKPQPSTQVKK